MYAPLLALIAMNLGRWFPRVQVPAGRVGRNVPSWPLLTGLAVLASFLLYRYKWSMSSGVVLPVLILAVGGFAVLDLFRADGRRALRWFALAGVALALAVVCRQIDVAGRFSGPDSWLQGHAFWHLLTSGSLGCMYLHQRACVAKQVKAV
jgi:predicted membrane channel-forming protein YqfA (hemolysin III family)